MNLKKADKLKRVADSMDKVIHQKENPASANQNITARRARFVSASRNEAKRLKKVQSILYCLSEMNKLQAPVNELCNIISSKSDVELLLSNLERTYTNFNMVSGYFTRYLNLESFIMNSKHRLDLLIKDVTTKKHLFDKWDLKSVNEQIRRIKKYHSLNIYTTQNLIDAVEMFKEIVSLAKNESDEDVQKRLIYEEEVKLIGRDIPGFFPTPKKLIEQLLYHARINDNNLSILEPSAGKGDIADMIKQLYGINPDVIEINYSLQNILKIKGHNVIDDDFMSAVTKQYDRIIMNPPFENCQDIDHVMHAYNKLSKNGIVVAIMSSGSFNRTGKKETIFKSWLEYKNHEIIDVEARAFKGKDSFRQTGVSTKIVVIFK